MASVDLISSSAYFLVSLVVYWQILQTKCAQKWAVYVAIACAILGLVGEFWKYFHPIPFPAVTDQLVSLKITPTVSLVVSILLISGTMFQFYFVYKAFTCKVSKPLAGVWIGLAVVNLALMIYEKSAKTSSADSTSPVTDN